MDFSLGIFGLPEYRYYFSNYRNIGKGTELLIIIKEKLIRKDETLMKGV